MYIKKEYDFNDLKNNSWSGAIITIERIEKENKEDALMELLEELFSESLLSSNSIPNETQINDFLWFDRDYIYESLGISDNEDKDYIQGYYDDDEFCTVCGKLFPQCEGQMTGFHNRIEATDQLICPVCKEKYYDEDDEGIWKKDSDKAGREIAQ